MYLLFRLKKMLKYLVILCCINICFSQESTLIGKAYYSKKHMVPESAISQMSKPQQPFFQTANSATFILEFSKYNSRFEILEKMDSDANRRLNSATILGGGKGVYFLDLKKDILLRQVDFMGELFLIKSIISDQDWKLIKETKQIGDYICYKAELLKNIKTSDGKNKTVTIEAWYSPELSFSFGPIGYSGLPGLILEISNDKAVYKIDKLELKSGAEHTIIKPKNGKLVSESTYNLLIEKAFKNR